MAASVWRSIQATIILAILLSGLYPVLIWGVGRLAFNGQASGSLLERNGRIAGSRLIGQSFSKPEYFHGRPSAAGEKGYDATSSSGSNWGPTNRKLADRLKADADRIIQENPGLTKGKIPVDLLTASGSGLDPHISPEGAEVQVERVAKARGLAPEQVRGVVQKHTDGPQWGLFGEPTVNVLTLNMELDQAKGTQ